MSAATATESRAGRIDTILEAAEWHLEQGRRVVPCGAVEKYPVGWDGWEKHPFSLDDFRRFFRDRPTIEPAIGLMMRPDGVIDIEIDSDEEQAVFAELFDGCEIPVTVTYRSTRGDHRIFRGDPRLRALGGVKGYVGCNGKKLGVRVGADGKGAQSLIPPSPGREFYPGLSFEDCEPALLPEVVIQRLLAQAKPKPGASKAADDSGTEGVVHAEALAAMKKCTVKMEDGADGSRRLFTVCCRAVAFDLSSADAIATVRAYEAERPFPRDYSDADILKRLEDAEGQAVRGSAKGQIRHLTDMGNAERFAEQHGADVRYCEKAGGFYVWDGRRWVPDELLSVEQRAKQVVRSIYREAGEAGDDHARKALADWGKKSEARDRINALISLSKSEPPIPVGIEDLDKNPWQFNCQNGTVDLLTGELRDHRREDLITKCCPVVYPANDAKPERWLRFLGEVFEGADDVIGYVQKLMGLSLVGKTYEHILPICYGTGGNGKGVLLDTWQYVLGTDYAIAAPEELIVTHRHKPHPTVFATLRGVRLAIASELEDASQLSEATVKRLTGGDVITARLCGQDFFQFEPSHTLILRTNYKPRVRGMDPGIWRRIRLIPFNVSFDDKSKDPTLTDKLRAEHGAILRWAVAGCLEWQKEGMKLTTPASVEAATAAYRGECDLFGRWVAECCLVVPGVSDNATDLFDGYVHWANAELGFHEKPIDFYKRLRGQFEKKKSHGVARYQGIQLREDFRDKVKKARHEERLPPGPGVGL